mmetsp:Transcript_22692/g.49167  ORF Transcript_22692/g.49167 Transcript_22692/m.49167 type:complete len:204 (+) Transcript_22692:2353-2964(+)
MIIIPFSLCDEALALPWYPQSLYYILSAQSLAWDVMKPTTRAQHIVNTAYRSPSYLKMIGSMRDSSSTTKAARELSEPAKPWIILCTTMDSSGPGFPASNDPRLPDSAHPSMLQANVPSGKPGRSLLRRNNLHLVRTPRGLKSRLIDVCVSSKKKSELMSSVKMRRKTAVAMARTDGVVLSAAVSSSRIRPPLRFFLRLRTPE